MKNFGFKVKIKYTKNSGYYRIGIKTETFRNVTEIHYCYPSSFKLKPITFESGIHKTGCTIFCNEIEEFEAVLEKEKARH